MDHFIKHKDHQRKWTSSVIWFTIAIYLGAGAFVTAMAFKMGDLNISRELEQSGGIKAKGLIFMAVMLGFVGLAFAFLRKPRHELIVRSYISFLFIWALIFIAMAISASTGSKHAVEIINDNCNQTGILHMVDIAYTTANSQLCSVACPCYGDTKKWTDRSDDQKKWDADATNITLAAARKINESVADTHAQGVYDAGLKYWVDKAAADKAAAAAAPAATTTPTTTTPATTTLVSLLDVSVPYTILTKYPGIKNDNTTVIAQSFQTCPVVAGTENQVAKTAATIDTLLKNATNGTSFFLETTKFGVNALGAVELDFNCSSMCW